jgi:phage terminase small subunit
VNTLNESEQGMSNKDLGEANKLTDKEEAYCQAFVNDPETRWNKYQSAVKAGYSENSAYSIGSENYRKPKIRARIDQLIEENRDIDKELIQRILEARKKVAFDETINAADRDKYLKALERYIGMDQQLIDVTSGGEKLPSTIQIEFVGADIND